MLSMHVITICAIGLGYINIPAYATLINSECWRQDETHLAPYTTEVAHCWSCQVDQMYYIWFAISVRRLLWLEIEAHVKSVTPSTMFPSTLIDASSGPVPRFWTLVFCHESFIPNVLRLSANLGILLITDHQVSWAVTAPIFPTYKIYSVDCLLRKIKKT